MKYAATGRTGWDRAMEPSISVEEEVYSLTAVVQADRIRTVKACDYNYLKKLSSAQCCYMLMKL